MRPSTLLALSTAALVAVALTSGCANTESPAGDTLFCVGAKCDDDSRGPTPLEPVPLDAMGRCRGVVDRASSDFFAVHEFRCTFDPPEGVVLEAVYTDIETPDRDRQGGPVDLESTDAVIGRLGNDDFPVRVRVTLAFKPAATENPGFQRTHYWGMEQVLADADALAAWTLAEPYTFGPPLEAWPIVFWPTQELVEAWDGGDAAFLGVFLRHEFEVSGSAELAVGGPTPLGLLQNRVQLIERAGERTDLRELAQQTRALLMPIGASDVLTLRTTSRDARDVESPLSGPGYYVIGLDGVATRTPVAELPELAVPVPAGDCNGACTEAEVCESTLCVPVPCGGACADGEQCVEGACVAPAPCGGLCLENEECVEDACVAVDPCEGACGESEACVAAECVARADQTQRLAFGSTTRCESPTAACDPGDDADCAEGHGCVDGQCRRLACQTQRLNFGATTSCESADAPCEIAGHCDDGHACVAGLCRRLACQNQNLNSGATTSCEAADQPCAAGADCDAGHTCVAGLCRRTDCQNQDLNFGSTTSCRDADQPCAVNDDCAAEHACVAGQCRRLDCQNQDLNFGSTTRCQAADQPCEVSAQCAEAHACGDSGVCERLACQPAE